MRKGLRTGTSKGLRNSERDSSTALVKAERGGGGCRGCGGLLGHGGSHLATVKPHKHSRSSSSSSRLRSKRVIIGRKRRSSRSSKLVVTTSGSVHQSVFIEGSIHHLGLVLRGGVFYLHSAGGLLLC